MSGKSSSRRRDRNRALAAGLLLLGICAGGLYVASHSVRTSDTLAHRLALQAGKTSGPLAQAGAPDAHAQSDDDLVTGSILFVPDTGNVCRRRLIDNRTWAIRDDGYVLCEDAASGLLGHNAGQYSATSRVEAIREGFLKR
ncbi:MAG: hypothetical protein KJZ73_16005 [Pseudorhodoplanes sp.]|nr:hypothetical protein [Pseudorhodoplanes sp.]MBW7948771.1 hypothetical protein [Pseudorhodoplanes sp.]MCL4712745.1 hypothetical protein [Pseudorhodoplanes sp.]MCQ3943942.1 hypothetical protein [Alphaproteobacteria bacterium]